jgi:hypothetical protein
MVALCVTALPLLIAACGGTSSGTASSASPTPAATASAAATAAITANWQAFFAGTTPAAKKITLLERGPLFAKVITAQAKSPLAQATQAKVTSVEVVSPTKATVKYSIVQGGQTALPDQTGQAVLQGGVWKVSARSFAALLALEGVKVALPSASP